MIPSNDALHPCIVTVTMARVTSQAARFARSVCAAARQAASAPSIHPAHSESIAEETAYTVPPSSPAQANSTNAARKDQRPAARRAMPSAVGSQNAICSVLSTRAPRSAHAISAPKTAPDATFFSRIDPPVSRSIMQRHRALIPASARKSAMANPLHVRIIARQTDFSCRFKARKKRKARRTSTSFPLSFLSRRRIRTPYKKAGITAGLLKIRYSW